MLIKVLFRIIVCMMPMWIAYAEPHWIDTYAPKFGYNDVLNTPPATPNSIIMQKGSRQIWIFDGNKWQNTGFNKGKINTWNIGTASINSITLKTNDFKVYHYDGKTWSLVVKDYPVRKDNIKDLIICYNELNSLLLITKDNQMYMFKQQKWQKIFKLTHRMGAYNYKNSQLLVWDYDTQYSSVYVYDDSKVVDTGFDKVLTKDEDIAQSYFDDPKQPIILTTKNNLWAYQGQKWNKIDISQFTGLKTVISDNAHPDSLVMLVGVESIDPNHQQPDLRWQNIYIYDGIQWSNSHVPLNAKEYIYAINKESSKSSIVVMTNLNRILVFDGTKWTDIGLTLGKDDSIPNGAWNAQTATPSSIVVGVSSTGKTKLMQYNGKSWSEVACMVCDYNGMEAASQSAINSLIVTKPNGKIFVYK